MNEKLAHPTDTATFRHLPKEDMISVLEELPASLETTVSGITVEGFWPHRTLLYPDPREQWPVPDIVGHLCDSARVWGNRLRHLVYDQEIPLEEFDAEYTARVSAYYLRPVASILREYRLLTQATAKFLRTITAAQWDMVYPNATDGTQTFHDLVVVEVHHEHTHIFGELPENIAVALAAMKR